MIDINDLITIPYTPDLTEGGITLACRSLPRIYNPIGSSSFDRLRRIAASAAVELALRRFLNQQNIPFTVRSAAPFSEPDRFDVSLGGHRCDLRSYLISHRKQITALRKEPGLLLNAPALVPLDQYSIGSQSAEDIYLFAFLTGLISAASSELKQSTAPNLPGYLIHVMPKTWSRPPAWIPLGPLTLKSETDEILTLEIGGQDAAREFLTRSLELPARTRCVVDADFYSLSYIHVKSKPGARLGVFSPSRNETYLIKSNGWGNIWVYGMDIYFTGWMSSSEFRQRARLIPEGSRVFQFDQTRSKNLAVTISDLKPMKELFERVRKWKG
jgi:hypothetical protein